MALEHELSTLPEHAIVILNYMAQHASSPLHITAMQHGTKLSDRALSKALKRLVTRKFLSMNAARQYQLTAKGSQSIDVLATGDIQGMQDNTSQQGSILFDLCVVLPSQVSAAGASELLVGVHPASHDPLSQASDIYLRFSTTDAELVPDEMILQVTPSQPVSSMPMTLKPLAGQNSVRLYIEAFQLFEMDEPAMAGGMFFDVPVGQGSTPIQVRAIHTPISLV